MEDVLANATGPISATESMINQDTLWASVENCGRVDELPNLTEEMVRRGFTDEEIRKIMGQNFLRVFEKVLRD